MADNLSSQIEAVDRLQGNGDLFLGPFPLRSFMSVGIRHIRLGGTHTPELIPLHLLLIPSSESSFVDKLRKLLLDEFSDFRDRSLEAGLARARNVQIQRWILHQCKSKSHLPNDVLVETHCRGGHGLVWVIIPACRDILKSQCEFNLHTRWWSMSAYQRRYHL